MIGLLIIAAVIAVFFAAFHLDRVIVSVNEHASPSEVTEMLLERPVMMNTVLTCLMNGNRTISDPGFVDSIRTTIVDRNTVHVSVRERRFVGKLKIEGNWWYFDGDGRILASLSEPIKGEFIPVVEGLSLDAEPVTGIYLPIAYSKAFSMLGMLRNRTEANNSLLPDLVEFSKSQAMTLHYDGVEVLMGQGEKFELRLKELEGILTEIGPGVKGTLHLENYDGSERGIVFDRS